MARKYQKYAIRVEYLNGDQENINLMGIRTDNYNKMLSVYHGIKERYADKVKTIDFCGVCEDGTMGVMWKKEIKQETGRTELNEDVVTVCNRIANDLRLVKEKYFHHSSMLSVLDKKEDIILHEIETSKKLGNLKKIELYDRLGEVRKARRFHKEQLKIIKELQGNTYSSNNINMTHLSNVFSLKSGSSEYEFNMKIADKQNQYHEEILKNKELQEAKLRKRFENVYTDEANRVIYAYNKCKKAI